MAEKQKKIVITRAGWVRTFVLPANAYIQHFNEYLAAWPSSWRSEGAPIFQVELEMGDMFQIEDISEDEELIEKIKTLSKDEMNTLRNIMDSTGLL